MKYVLTLLCRHVPSFQWPSSTHVSLSPKRPSPEICYMPALRLLDIGHNLSELGLARFEPVRIGVKCNLLIAESTHPGPLSTLLQRCCGVVATLLQHCCGVVATLLRLCYSFVATLLRHCCDLVATLLRRCCDVVVMIGVLLRTLSRCCVADCVICLAWR